MTTASEESKAEREAGGNVCAACGTELQDAAKRVEQGVNTLKTAVSAKLEDGKIAAERLLKRGRFAVEDGIDQTAHAVKHHPFSALAIAFAAGAALGLLAPRLGRK